MNRLTEAQAPTDQQIEELENQLKAMKAAREEAKRKALVDVRAVLADIPNALKAHEIIWLMTMLNNKLKSNHRKVRGSPVPDELKTNLTEVLKTNKYSLSELSSIFDLSVSYIARTKKELGLTATKSPKPKDPEPAQAAPAPMDRAA